MSKSKYQIGDYVQVLSQAKRTQDKKIILDSAIIIDIVVMPGAVMKNPNIVVDVDTYGYILCPHPGPLNKTVAETALRKRPESADMGWSAIKLYCKFKLKS